MNTKIISLIVIALFLFSCGNTSNEKSKKSTESVTHEEHNQDKEVQTLELNNGEKWKVNDEMMPPILNMEKEINAFVTEEQKDYKSLAKQLQKDINLLISSCTMKGKSHEELHKWLLPFIALVKELSEAKNETEAAKSFENIQTSFTTFNKYFR